MEFIKLDTTKTSTQKFRVFNSSKYDLDCTIELDSKKNIIEITVSMADLNGNNHEIKSVLLCQNAINNNSTFYYLLVNMEIGNHKKSFPLKPNDPGYPNQIKMSTGDLIFVDAYEYKDAGDEINKCSKIKIFDFDFDPKHKKGSIIVGNP